MKVAFPYGLHGHQHRTLYNPISQGWYPQWALLAVGLRNIDTTSRLRLIGSGQQL